MRSNLRKHPRARGWRAPAFTLVEILVAISLTGLIVAISSRVALQMVETRNTAHRMNAPMERRSALGTLISEDFARILTGPIKDKPALVVVEGSMLVLEFSALAAVSTEEESLHTPLKPCLVRYWKQQEVNTTYRTYRLERQIIDLTDPARVIAKEPVAGGIEDFGLAIRRKGEWSDAATVSLLDAKEIEAVQVRARWINDPVEWQQTFPIEHEK